MLKSIVSLLLIFLLAALSVYSISFVLPTLASLYGRSVYFTVPMSWIGGAIGGVLLSMLADRWSRRMSLLISIFLFTIPLIMNIAIRELPLLYLIWFIIGFGVNGENGLSYAYAAELAPPRYRGLVGSLMQGLYFIGGLIGLIWAILFKNVNAYFLSLGLISCLSFALWFLIPESRWRNRSYRGSTSRDLIRTVILGSIFAVGSFLFIVPLVSLSFTVLSMLKVDSFLILSIALILGMISFTLAGRVSDSLGRKKTTFVFVAISIVFSIVMLVSLNSILIALTIIALMIGSSFFAYFGVWMSEVFPPETRATWTNAVFFLGRLVGGGFGVSLVLLMPFGLKDDLGAALLISSLLVLISVIGLPETVKINKRN
ncbi:MFS transporter [Metallosphaera cuprina]|uniref:Major facilitator transporter n=1 Tax=Metallosphaera cuprina (strain Ar-4) TaxID=1006006 RepID=F4FY64_METCR|nr:MFS transporter [Metallosphaera cuprina]AEB95437.1 major facilitator transporter [Metallosphaera cuprina Ar-4]